MKCKNCGACDCSEKCDHCGNCKKCGKHICASWPYIPQYVPYVQPYLTPMITWTPDTILCANVSTDTTDIDICDNNCYTT